MQRPNFHCCLVCGEMVPLHHVPVPKCPFCGALIDGVAFWGADFKTLFFAIGLFLISLIIIIAVVIFARAY